MCGIAGIIRFDGTCVNSETLARMSDCLAHRGPDDLGFLSWSPNGSVKVSRNIDELPGGCSVGFAHRRLSILDVTRAGAQPMSTPDGRYHIVFNGEIYNYLELREELEAKGVRFRSRSDTEVLLSAWAHWGHEAISRLVGMFAAVILDTKDRKLLLVRDFFGIKPLYYVSCERFFAFSSELKSLLEIRDVARRANPSRLYEYLRFGMTDYGDQTLLADIHQLRSAHYIEIPVDSHSEPEQVCYWRMDTSRQADLSFDAAAERLRELFLRNVQIHLRSDVSVGAALSGGIDSSSIVMAMRHIQGADLQISTFSYIASDNAINEEKWVDLIVNQAGAHSHKVKISPEELVGDLDDMIGAQSEPVSTTSMYAQYRVFRLAHDAGIKVMLDGQGADEILGGYRYFVGARVTSLLRQGRLLAAARLLARAMRLPGPAGGLWILCYTGAFMLPDKLKAPALRLIGQNLLPQWLNGEWFRRRSVLPEFPRQCRRRDALREQMFETLTRTSVPKLLRYEDRNSMAFSVESRVPFLTPELAEFCLSLPEEYHIGPDGTGKLLFRRAMHGIVPEEILERKDKIGFETPEKNWLTALKPWADSTFRSDAASAVSPLNFQEAQKEWQAVAEGRKRFDRHIWRMVNLIRWSELMGIRFDD